MYIASYIGIAQLVSLANLFIYANLLGPVWAITNSKELTKLTWFPGCLNYKEGREKDREKKD